MKTLPKFLADRIPAGWHDRLFNGSQYGYVYVIKCNGLYKIGSCRDYHKRFSSIRIQEGFPVDVIRLYETDAKLVIERKIQKALRPYCFQRNTSQRGKDREWFNLPSEDVLPV